MRNKDVQVFKPSVLESVCRAIAAISGGLTDSEIGHFLKQTGIKDPDPGITKWMRLFNALSHRQNQDGKGNCVLRFISIALAPSRYLDKSELFEDRRAELNKALGFLGLKFGEDGSFVRGVAATTLAEAEARVERLRAKLIALNTHADVIASRGILLHQNNHFHAILEASKSVAEKIRTKSGLIEDGAVLIDGALGGQSPILRINNYVNKTEQDEQKGFVNLLKGLFWTFRNPTAHAPQIIWPMPEEDALDLFALVSCAHRRIDKFTR